MTQSRRSMNGSASAIARRTQAARDALKRRHKEKKARIVKRHVRHKEKQKLLAQLAKSEKDTPIVAPELGALEDNNAAFSSKSHQTKSDGKAENLHSGGIAKNKDQESISNDANESSEEVQKESPTVQDEKRLEQKSTMHMPFAKERKQYEEARKKREQEQREREENIRKRETMLRKSKKRRKEQAKQYRSVTKRGQPKMKHRVEELLARIQKQ